jgi:hypothetical protein
VISQLYTFARSELEVGVRVNSKMLLNKGQSGHLAQA